MVGRGRMGKGGVDWDDVLSYKTVKMIKIKNKCVGGMHYGFMFMIAMYLTFYIFLYQKHYLQMDNPVQMGNFRTLGPCQPIKAAQLCTSTHGKPTKAVGEMCTRDFMCNKLPYCAAKNAKTFSSVEGGKQPCVYWDHNLVTWPPSERNALTIATRVSQYKQTLKKGGDKGPSCAPAAGKLAQTDWDCQYSPAATSGNSMDGYVADVGNYTINLAQSVMARHLPISKTGSEMTGELLRCKEGKKCSVPLNFETSKKFVPNDANTGNAMFTVEDMLKAMVPVDDIGQTAGTHGVDLDKQSSACPGKCASLSTGKHLNSTTRWMGMVVLVEVQYDNTGLLIEGSSEENVKYQLKFWPVKNSVFNLEVPYMSKDSSRVVYHYTGLRLVTMVTGQLGLFSMHAVLVTLSTSVAMLLLSTTLVDVLLLSFMRNSAYYKFVKYEDDEERINDILENLEYKDIPSEEKERLAQQAESLRVAEVDWKGLFTGTLAGQPREVDPNLFSVKRSGPAHAKAGEQQPLLQSVAVQNDEQREEVALPQAERDKASGGCCR